MTTSPATEPDSHDTSHEWDLSRLYESPADPRIDAELEQARSQAKALQADYHGRIAQAEPSAIRHLLDGLDAIASLSARLFGYAYLLFSADTQTEDNKRLYARIQSEIPDIRQEIVGLELELQNLSQERFDALLAAPELASYHDHLRRMRRLASHALNELAEKILNMKEATGSQAWTQLYYETTADFRVHLGLPEHPEEMTLSQAYAVRETGQRHEREAAFNETLRLHRQQSRVLTPVYNALFENWRHTILLRGYAHPLSPLLVEEAVTPETIETLIETVESRHELVQRYFRGKARLLGYDDFASHDIRANYSGQNSFISYEEGRDIVLDTFASFSDDLGQVAAHFFEARYIDAFSRTGKRAGAYCLSAGPVFHPYLFLNYNFTLKDVITTAHELGHGVHNVVAGRHHNLTNSDRMTLFMETPSTFAETLTFQRLIYREVRPEVRQALLGNQLESAILKIFKSVALTRFQLEAYKRREQGVIPAETFCVMWDDRLASLYGDSVRRSEWDAWEWLTFHHILNHPFYDYAYAFGQLLVFALVRQFQQDRQAFEPRFMSLLEAGTSLTIGDLLTRVDIRIDQAAIWQEGLAYFEQMLEEFESGLDG
ncbi:MAG: M3 family metallopeptidase [Candidatus Sericytochromatia bacterium]|nr:M3 family metallopeptidase [Candidatus Sericytochromatia bacterium]